MQTLHIHSFYTSHNDLTDLFNLKFLLSAFHFLYIEGSCLDFDFESAAADVILLLCEL